MDVAAIQETMPGIIIHSRSGRRPAAQMSDAPGSFGSQAALREFTLERLVGYGVDYADAVELRGRVTAGEGWQAVAMDLAANCIANLQAAAAPASATTHANRLYRAAALHRMSQMMMLTDDDERREIYGRAVDLYRLAAIHTGDREHVIVGTEQGPLAGWLFPSQSGPAVGCAVVIGGLEGWAMDFCGLGLELARRNVETLVLDGPGQGESRLLHRHYLTRNWVRSYQNVFAWLSVRTGGAPMAFVGNSLGGGQAIHLASQDPRIVACCNNGGPRAIGGGGRRAGAHHPGKENLARKILAFCGEANQSEAADILPTLSPMAPGASLSCPFLIVHGALDDLVSTEDVKALFDWAKSADKQLVIYADGDHCVYNRTSDKHDLISDWISNRLIACAEKRKRFLL